MDAKLNRRDFLFYGGALVAGVTLGEAGRRQLARADERAAAWRPRGQVTWATSVCRECPAGCGIRVRLVDGVPVKLDGNPLCPIARGRLCAKGQAAIEGYFDADRLVGPARRVGPRGSGRWEPASWDEAITWLARPLSSPARHDDVLVLAAEEHGPMADAWMDFWGALGARVAWTTAPTAARLRSALESLTGCEADPAFDLEQATFVLSFGAPIVETWLSPLWTQRAYGRFRRGAAQQRGHLVQIDGRRSLTARKADEWLPVPEDRQAALAYGIASVLLREHRVDQTFLDQFGGNVADFERAVSDRLTPDRVAEATGVPVVTLLRLARELAAASRPLIVVAADAPPELADAALALDALVGAFDRPGGIFATGQTTRARADLDDASDALRQVAAGHLHPRVVVLRDASALRTRTSPPDLVPALGRAELVVSFSPYLDETAALADWLLPVHTPLESWHAVEAPQVGFIEARACARPATKARLDTRDLFSVLGAVAEKAGGALAGTPWRSSEDVVISALDRLARARRGAPYAGTFETDWIRELESGGWWIRATGSGDDFSRTVLDAGGWMDPYFAPGGIRQALAARKGLSFGTPVAMLTPIAASEPDVERDAGRNPNRQYPLRLIPFTPAIVSLVGSPNQPALYEMVGQSEGASWRTWVELNPDTARSLGIEDGARVRIESASGAFEATARHVAGTPGDMVAVAFLPAAPANGRWAQAYRPDIRQLWGQNLASRSCAVQIRKA